MAITRKSIFSLFLLAAVIMGFQASPVMAAEGFGERVKALAAKGFKAKSKAIRDLAATGHERVPAVLEALLGGKLYRLKSDGKVVITRKRGRVYILLDPLKGSELGQVAKKKIRKIRVNNRLRGVIRGILGGLTLLARDPAKRLAAARALFKARDPKALGILQKAIERETEDNVRDALELARQAILATSAKRTEARISAIRSLSEKADPQVGALLGSIIAATKDASLRAAAEKALKKVEDRLALWNTVGDLFRGISLGSVLLLAAVGLAITFGVMGVINMAHGELVMLGAYTTFAVQEVFRLFFPGGLDYSLILAVPSAFAVAGLTGIAIERGVIRHLYGRPLETLLATWGLSLVLRQTVRIIFGPTNREVSNPSWMSGAIDVTGGLSLTYNRIWIILFALVVLALIGLLMRRTSFGLEMRAVTQNRQMAGSMGIRTGRVDALTFGLGSGIAGVAGVALSQIDNVGPNLGQAYIVDSFMVVVFGGVGNLWGTLVGAFGLGIANKFLEPVSGAVLAKILVLVAIILFIQKRPRGLFALKGRAVEN
ncbi:MAG: urea ABC transporter permease subunit UrtB [Rhodospirillales bacterium]|jgi:urea transport system permease protein|nr:urea ABC transporter permease subunit UrtB [Rhodospirillales bacterium]